MKINIKNYDFRLLITKSWDGKIIFSLDCFCVREPRFTNVYYLSLHWKGKGFRHTIWWINRFISITNFAPLVKAKRFRKDQDVQSQESP